MTLNILKPVFTRHGKEVTLRGVDTFQKRIHGTVSGESEERVWNFRGELSQPKLSPPISAKDILNKINFDLTNDVPAWKLQQQLEESADKLIKQYCDWAEEVAEEFSKKRKAGFPREMAAGYGCQMTIEQAETLLKNFRKTHSELYTKAVFVLSTLHKQDPSSVKKSERFLRKNSSKFCRWAWDIVEAHLERNRERVDSPKEAIDFETIQDPSFSTKFDGILTHVYRPAIKPVAPNISQEIARMDRLPQATRGNQRYRAFTRKEAAGKKIYFEAVGGVRFYRIITKISKSGKVYLKTSDQAPAFTDKDITSEFLVKHAYVLETKRQVEGCKAHEEAWAPYGVSIGLVGNKGPKGDEGPEGVKIMSPLGRGGQSLASILSKSAEMCSWTKEDVARVKEVLANLLPSQKEGLPRLMRISEGDFKGRRFLRLKGVKDTEVVFTVGAVRHLIREIERHAEA